MDDQTRRVIQGEIATLESSNNRARGELNSKQGILPSIRPESRRGLENEIQGLKKFIAANEERIRDFRRRL